MRPWITSGKGHYSISYNNDQWLVVDNGGVSVALGWRSWSLSVPRQTFTKAYLS